MDSLSLIQKTFAFVRYKKSPKNVSVVVQDLFLNCVELGFSAKGKPLPISSLCSIVICLRYYGTVFFYILCEHHRTLKKKRHER